MMTDNDSNKKSNGHDKDGEDAEKIISFPSLKERDAQRKKEERERAAAIKPPSEPLFNLPQVTKMLVITLLGFHLARMYVLPLDLSIWVRENMGFIPAAYTSFDTLLTLPAIIGPVTHMLIHAGWMHLAMNTVMLLAFGSGLERMVGPKKMVQILLISGICGAVLHALVYWGSTVPVFGASGGISGLFAAVLVTMIGAGGERNIMPFVILWLGISIGFGFFGGGNIAWAAHVGGFLAGLLFTKPIIQRG